MEDIMSEKMPWIYQDFKNLMNINWDDITYDEFLDISKEIEGYEANIGYEFIDMDEENLDWQSIYSVVQSIEQSIYDEESKKLMREIDVTFEKSKRDTTTGDQMLRDIGIKLNE
jgi:hypothetical protein